MNIIKKNSLVLLFQEFGSQHNTTHSKLLLIFNCLVEDSFHNNFLYDFTKESTLLLAINKSWDRGIFLETFIKSTLVPMLKPNKDPHIILSYRPFGLFSCLGKLMKRLI